ncbi:MAG TPA: glycine--tRNA ligase subunit beta, partial [Candidatus Polarisedimenticolia bacterium]|nr:glycine--tRNA ligase subunit beta [Candidatus Polarisedimenticolia bacterium]
ARLDGLPEPVARAIEDHYKPTSPDGELPAAIEACLLSLADRIDLLAGCFAIGLLPKGSSDPYGLRRAAHGVCRLLLSAPMASLPRRIHFPQAVQAALEGYSGQGIQAAPGAGRAVVEFTGQRLRFMMEEDGMRLDTARAVLSAGFDDLHDAWQRAAALTTLRGPQHEADFLALASSAKRIRNILSQAAEMGIGLDGVRADPKRLVDAEEKDLHAAIEGAAAEVDRLAGSRDYQAALRRIASVRPQVDRFFDKVLVMAPDERLRLNRLALLKGLSALLSRVADFSEIVVEGESTERDA